MSFGVFLLVPGSAVLHASWNVVARKVSGHPVAVWAGLWVASILLAPLVWNRFHPGTAWNGVLSPSVVYPAASGLIHAAYFALLAYAYEQGAISLVYPVARGSGVALIGGLAFLFFHEEISLIGALGIVFISAGIFSMARDRARGNLNGFPLALGVGASIAVYSLVDKHGVKHIDPVPYIWITWTVAAVLLTPFVLLRFRRKILSFIRRYLWESVVIGVGSVGAYLMILFALLPAPVSYVAAIRELAIVLGAGAGIVFLGEKVTKRKALGIAVILLGVILVKLG